MSNDLDYFHDSEGAVANSFAKDRELLERHGHRCEIELSQPGYIRCLISKDVNSTKVEWAYDTAWRFLPTRKVKGLGHLLHPIDLAINKVLAVAGRDEARDFLDLLHAHRTILPLGALCWAACGKDPGWTPHSLLDLLKRKGKYHPEDFTRLHLQSPVDLPELKRQWQEALSDAETFMRAAPPEELGHLYYSRSRKEFIAPDFNTRTDDIQLHAGRPGGVLPSIRNETQR